MPSQESPRLVVLVSLSAMAVLPINMFVPSLPNIAKDLNADFALVNIAIAGYAMATAVTHLLAGALSDRFGRKPVALFALAIFTIASMGCGLATDITTFLLCRLFQGAVIAGYAVSLAIIHDTSDEGMVASRIGYVSSAWAVAPMIGPAIGGFLDTGFGWRANFIAFAVLGVSGLYLVAFHLKETKLHRSAALTPQMWDYGELCRAPLFWAHVLCMALSIGTLYVFLGGAPLVAAQLGGTSSAALGFYMGMVPAGFILGSHLVGRASTRQPAIGFMLTGRVLTCMGLLGGMVFVASGWMHPLAFFIPCVFVGLGNGLTMPVANARVLSLHPQLAGTASGLAAAVTVMGAGVVAWLSGLVVNPLNAHMAVLSVMLITAGLSLAACLFIVDADGK
ncbi:putative MFS family arabinose efflux permease [Hydrogenophaga palleronii]|uniref:MFS family arabinose efflux permease n=1 Tax=Hydrogenophaga palleronii TaxID=65655 RepID=A0ABU1WQK7_9BURK|nr:MFS transporter [Hydrogenophaga palleronii]MDR7151573.1 putative MFS family arabinose efflux permease [Hydrogenophaga palleronii]